MTKIELSVEESYLVQSLALVECLINLQRLEMADDPDFERIKNKIFGQAASSIKSQNDAASIFGGQGGLLSVLYLLLVLPHEWGKKQQSGLENIDSESVKQAAYELAIVKVNTYTLKNPYQEKEYALTHLRNALAHGRVGWSEGMLEITDIDHAGHKYVAQYSKLKIGYLLQEAFETATKWFIMRANLDPA